MKSELARSFVGQPAPRSGWVRAFANARHELKVLAWAVTLAAFGVVSATAATTNFLAFAPAPPDNPLKGFVAYPGPRSDFPHSLVWNYISLRSLMTGPTNFQWEVLERELAAASRQGRQFIPRFHLDFPGTPIAIPQFLIDAGVKVRTWTNTNTQPWPPTVSYTPDYQDARLRSALTNFIHALSARYDGDPRLAFLPMGLLGTWGEWHNSPRDEWFASKTVQREVMDAYQLAFKTTRILARYPAGPSDFTYASNHQRPLGYHDDSFAWATMETGRPGDEWFFRSRLLHAGAAEKWRDHPIGGEVRPEVWACLWDTPTCAPAGQEFVRCATNIHASWLANDGVFSRNLTGDRLQQALAGARLLGYEFQVTRAIIGDAFVGVPFRVELTLTNSGIAPFYYPWPLELAALHTNGAPAETWAMAQRLTGLLPAAPAVTWTHEVPKLNLAAGRYRLAMRVVHPLTNGLSLRFANASQDQHRRGWLTLGELTVEARPRLRAEVSPHGFLRIETTEAISSAFQLESSVDLRAWQTWRVGLRPFENLPLSDFARFFRLRREISTPAL